MASGENSLIKKDVYLIAQAIAINCADKDTCHIGSRVVTLKMGERQLLRLELPVLGSILGRSDVVTRDRKIWILCIGGPGVEGKRNLPRDVRQSFTHFHFSGMSTDQDFLVNLRPVRYIPLRKRRSGVHQ
jgi:hypothetical protein